MDGKNASGRRVSLLNDCGGSPASTELPLRLSSTSPSLRSRTSSYISSPIGSPPIPQLIRSDSSDSNAMPSPSPTTPSDYNFDSLQNHHVHTHDDDSMYTSGPTGFFSSIHRPLESCYPPPSHIHASLPYANTTLFPQAQLQPQSQHGNGHYARHVQDALHVQQPIQVPQPLQLQQPLPPALPQSQIQQPPQPHQPRRDSASRPTGPACNGRNKKNQYPCPMAKQYNCHDFFTTSGHAARHAKKHTGKKDAYCPECNKAFTRKDNMEQHRRTHASGRNASKGADNGVKKAKQHARRPKPTVLQPIAAPMAQLNTVPVDPNLPTDSGFSLSPAESYYPDPTSFAVIQSQPFVGQYEALDALATVASGEQRKYGS